MKLYSTFMLMICTRELNLIRGTRAFSVSLGKQANAAGAAKKMDQSHFEGVYKTSVAVCQFNARNNKDENFQICKGLIEKASVAGAKMVFLPEACDYIGESKEEVLKLAEPLDGPLLMRYKELARSTKVWLSLGGIHERVNASKVHNSHVVINDAGEIVSIYRKLHLFDVEMPDKKICLKESDYVIKGDRIVKPVVSPVGTVGLGICYDLRFPEMSLALTKLGANILTYPSAFTFTTGAVHWEVLLRTRAIENQCYVIAAAQYGAHNKKRTSWGHAMIVDPTGNIVAQCSEGTGFVMANIDFDLVTNVRRSMPLSLHRRTDIYPELLPLTLALDNLVDSSKKMETDSGVTASGDAVKQAHPEGLRIEPVMMKEYQFGQVMINESCIFFKTNKTMAFVNKRCVVPGHVLVAPLRPALRMKDLNSEEVADLFLVVQKVEKVMEQVHGAASTTLAVQDGPDAGRTIRHLHVHILPRKENDFLHNDQIYYELQQHDKDETKPCRDPKEMTGEAELLRKYFPPTASASQ